MRRFPIFLILLLFYFPHFVYCQICRNIYLDIFDTIGGDIESVFSSKKCSEIEYIKERVENGHSDYTWFHESYFLKYKGLPIEFTSLKVHKKDRQLFLYHLR